MRRTCQREVEAPDECRTLTVPCGRPATCLVLRPPHGGGPESWRACPWHGAEAEHDGCETEAL